MDKENIKAKFNEIINQADIIYMTRVQKERFIDPVEFGVGASLRYITFIVVGGLGSIAGSIVGSVIFTLLPEGLRGIKEYSDLVYAVILLLSLVFLPNGLISLYQRLVQRRKRANLS